MIVPGSANSLLMAKTGDPLDELGVVTRSLRTRLAASSYVSRTPGASGNKSTWTVRVIVKRGKLGTQQGIFGAKGAAQDTIQVFFDSDDTLKIIGTGTGGGVGLAKYTSQVFRDTAATLDIVIGIDTTQATAVNRFSLEINGKAITSFATSTDPALNDAYPVNGVNVHVFGATIGTLGVYVYSDQLVSFPSIIDGKKVSAASFGQFHPTTGQWRPKGKASAKALADGGGTNSCFLPFDDPTNTITLCADASSKGNNWTANNISLTAGATYDSMLDTPTANYATLNPLIPASLNPAVLSNANLSAGFTATAQINAFLNMPLPKSGLWNWEVECVTGGTPVGIAVGVTSQPNASGLLGDPNGYSYYNSTGQKYAGATASAYGSAWYGASRADVITVLYDADARALSFRLNGVSQGVAFTLPAGVDWFPIGSHTSGTSTHTENWNLGQRPLLYPVAGAKGLCTKNLPLPSIQNPAAAFVAVSDSGANVQATLAAARPSWGAYLEIFKRRDAVEGWRWRFSDDAASCLDSSSTAAKAAFPALAGTSYVGYALKVSAINGVATGTFSHINGTPDTISDGLGNVRKMIFLKRTDAAGSWFVYHPELTAGKLLYLEQQVVETTDATISNVTSSSFTVAAALSTGTYRWLALAEIPGFLKLGKHIDNASADGPFGAGDSPVVALFKYSSAGTCDWMVYDSTRNSSNAVTNSLRANSTAAEASRADIDLVSNGYKVRSAVSTSDSINFTGAGGTHIYLSIAAFPFRYANAR